jgi:hypothetical protein
VTLAAFAAEKRTALFEALSAGLPPPFGDFDQAALNQGKAKGFPLMGPTRFEPNAVFFEFHFPDPNGAPILLTVKVEPPEGIVYMPVPEWVVAQVWEGEVLGSFRFESEARQMLAKFESGLEPDENASQFDEEQVVGKR